MRLSEEEEEGGRAEPGDEGLRSSVTCTSDPAALGTPHEEQKLADCGVGLPQVEQ
jgi:hypothetical protein